MRVHWKKLCTLGALFWAGMTAYDYYYGSILVPGEFKSHELLSVPGYQDASNSRVEIEETSWSFWGYTMAFLSLITLLTIAYLSMKYYPRKRLSKSKELIAANEAMRTALFNVAYDTSEPSTDDILVIHENMCDVCSGTCCKTKEESIEVILSNKEIATLNKKIDVMNEEKRNLTRFLAQSEKDNRTIKQKMMEVLRDKNVLLKRLEAATREIRSNTVARQATLDKLEESLQYSNQLKGQIQDISAERTDLARKLRMVETQCKNMKRQHSQDPKPASSRRSNGVKATSKVKVVDSTKDIEQIELKLHDLEVSLEKMKGKSTQKPEEFDTDDNDTCSESSEPKILRQVSSSDMNFLSEVEPSYTNLLAKYDSDTTGGALLHQKFVESIAPTVPTYCDMQDKFTVPCNFGSTVFSMYKHVQRQRTNCFNDLLQTREPIVLNYAIVCNYKCPYADRLAMLGRSYFGLRRDEEVADSAKNGACRELVRYEQLPDSTS